MYFVCIDINETSQSRGQAEFKESFLTEWNVDLGGKGCSLDGLIERVRLDGEQKAAEYRPQTSKQIDFRQRLGGNLIEYATVDNSKSLGYNDVNGADTHTAKRTKRPRPDGTNDAIPKKRKNDRVTGEAELKSGEAEAREASVDTPGQGLVSSPSTPVRRASRPTSKALGAGGKAKAGVENAKNRVVSTRPAPGADGPNTVTTPKAATVVARSSIPRSEQPSQPNRSVGTAPKPITPITSIAPSVATPGTSSIPNPDASKAPGSAVGNITPSAVVTPGPPPIPNPDASPKAPGSAAANIAPSTATTSGPSILDPASTAAHVAPSTAATSGPLIPNAASPKAPAAAAANIAPSTAATSGPPSIPNPGPDALPRAPASAPSAVVTSGPNATCSTTKAPPSFGTPQPDARTPVPGSYDTTLSPEHTSRPQLQITSSAGMVIGSAEAPTPSAQGVGGNEDIRKQVLFCRKNRDLAMRALKEATEHYNLTSVEYDNAIQAVLGL